MKCCLVGNQNSGKSLLFNLLTGLNQKVGNWPGVTVERKDGIIKDTDYSIVDLPGIYSLSPYTSEEEISREFILNEKPDLIINIIDSTSIERSLYLTTQLLELNTNVLVVLNMEDILKKKGYEININKLQELLGTKVISISALKKIGIENLIKTIKENDVNTNKNLKIYPSNIENLISKIEDKLPEDIYFKRFIAVKVIEREENYKEYLDEKINQEIEDLEKFYDVDSEQLIATERYNFIEKVRNDSVKKVVKETLTQKIDKIILNKYLAIPIFIVVMAIVYMLSVGVIGGLTVNLMDAFFNGSGGGIDIGIFEYSLGTIPSNFIGIGPWLSDVITNAGGSSWAASLVSDGVVAGFGAVCNFLPQLIILFLCLALLETSGYMSRITFLFDHFFKKIGMSGKSLVPFIVGTGCSVPAIMAARTVEDSNEHKLTVVLTPFVPCSAKLPIISCFVGGLFAQILGGWTWLVTLSMYFLAVIVIVLVGWFANKFFIKNKNTSYLTELPDYHAPSISYICKDVFDKTLSFIKRAGTIIVLCSVVIWLLLHITWDFKFINYTEDDLALNAEMMQDSFLALIGKTLSWIFAPMLGFNMSWGATVSAIQGLVAKEAVVSSMEVINAVQEGGNIFAQGTQFAFFNGFSAYGYMIFTLFSAPCFGAIGAMRRELGSSKEMWKALFIETGVAWILASLVGMWGVFL